MLSASRERIRGAQLSFSPTILRPTLQWSIPLLLGITLAVGILLGAFRRANTVTPAADSWVALASGVQGVEHAAGHTYVYTDGDAQFRFPETGRGTYLVTLSLGGLSGSIPAITRITTGEQAVNLGALTTIRTYRLLLPANNHGDLQIGIKSPVQYLAPDPRPLGALVERISVEALGPTIAPLPVLITTAIALGLFWIAIGQLPIRWPWKATTLLLISIVLSGAYMFSRGRVALQPITIGLGLAAVAAMWLSRHDTNPLLTSRRGTLIVFGLWRVALWLMAGSGLLYSRDVYRYGWGNAVNVNQAIGDRTALVWRMLAGAWMEWDSVHYVAIAQAGYTFFGVRWPRIAFFPLYPLLLRMLLPLTRSNAALAALLASHLALGAALVLLYDLVERDFGRIVAYRATVFLLVFPTAFFLVAGYSESLALALAIVAVWAIRRERWWLAGIAGGLLAMTRVPGVFIAPVLGLCYLQSLGWRWRTIRAPLLAVLLPPLGLGLFMAYQWWRFGTPFAFLIAQQNWKNGAAPPWIIPTRIVAALGSPQWEMATLQLIVWLSYLALTLLALRRLPLAYGLTGLLLLLPAYLANQPGSLIRHVLIGFPVFVMFGLVARPLWFRWLLTTMMLAGLAVLTLMFVNGFFVA